MLLELKVSNFAIIDHVHINFKPGLNILSGETGAGKSVLIKGLSLLMGGKSDAKTVRQGATQATIEGFFDLSGRSDIVHQLESLGIDSEEENLVVRRVISAQGKNRVYINGSLCALNNLREVVAPLIELTNPSAPLIEMTSQHENRHLTSRAYHLDLLDQYAGLGDLREEYRTCFQEGRELEEKIEDLKVNSQMHAQRLDFLRFQTNEIESFGFKEDEVDIEQDVKRLRSSREIAAFKTFVDDTLYEDEHSVLTKIHQIIQRSAEFRTIDLKLIEKLEPLTQAKAIIDDMVYDLRDYDKMLDVDPDLLEEKEQRLSDLKHLKKKYGPEVKDVLAFLEKSKIEIHQLENSDQNIKGLLDKKLAFDTKLKKLALELHKRRQQAAKLLTDGVNDELKELNMKGLTFEVGVDFLDEVHGLGQSRVEFLTRATKKGELKPLAKYASGGELSRILLSLKQVIGHSNQPRTHLFDEIDAGVSGETAERVGKKLKSISKGQQVICITHLPQVAAQADAHYYLNKSANSKSVEMEIIELNGDKRVNEIARLISGTKITKTSLAHAKQLIG